MPILDGYDSCRKILGLYQKDSIIKGKDCKPNRKKSHISRNSYDGLKLSEIKPVMVANTSLLSDAERAKID